MAFKAFLHGSIAGTAATLPMTLVMQVGYRLLPRHEQYPLWPSEIVQKLGEETHTNHTIGEEQHVALSLTAHFGYGAAAGAVYGAVASRLVQRSMLNGIGYGLVVWASSYLGWLPIFRILIPATEQPRARVVLNIAAHIVWGAALELIFERLQQTASTK